jgi:hypothetical protein
LEESIHELFEFIEIDGFKELTSFVLNDDEGFFIIIEKSHFSVNNGIEKINLNPAIKKWKAKLKKFGRKYNIDVKPSFYLAGYYS